MAGGGGSPWVPCQLARPRPRWTIRFWLLKSLTRPPQPQSGLDRIGLKSETLLYNIGVSALSTHNNLSPSTERCERRASLASLALGDELTGATSSGSCPARTSMCWPWSTSSLGTVPAGTTEAQVDGQILVAEVAGEATPSPNPA